MDRLSASCNRGAVKTTRINLHWQTFQNPSQGCDFFFLNDCDYFGCYSRRNYLLHTSVDSNFCMIKSYQRWMPTLAAFHFNFSRSVANFNTLFDACLDPQDWHFQLTFKAACVSLFFFFLAHIPFSTNHNDEDLQNMSLKLLSPFFPVFFFSLSSGKLF